MKLWIARDRTGFWLSVDGETFYHIEEIVDEGRIPCPQGITHMAEDFGENDVYQVVQIEIEEAQP